MVSIDDGKFVTVKVEGGEVRTHYYELGAGRQETVLFMHTGGAGVSAYMCWYKNLDAFAEMGYHVLAPDLIGYGRTGLAPGQTGAGPGAGAGAGDVPGFAAALMDTLGVRQVHLVGNSMGSQASVSFAVQHPERARSLTLSGGFPRLNTEQSRIVAATLGRTPRMEFVREMFAKPQLTYKDMRWATADFFYDRNHSGVDEVTRMRLDTLQQDPELLQRVKEDALGQVRSGRTFSDASFLVQFQAPTYLLHGRDEKYFYPLKDQPLLMDVAVKVAFVIPDCNCTLLSRVSHWPQIEKADTYNALALAFLNSLPR